MWVGGGVAVAAGQQEEVDSLLGSCLKKKRKAERRERRGGLAPVRLFACVDLHHPSFPTFHHQTVLRVCVGLVGVFACVWFAVLEQS